MRIAAIRSIDDVGRLVLPAEVRSILGLAPGSRVAYDVDAAEGVIVLRPVRTGCVFCGGPIPAYGGRPPICPACCREAADHLRRSKPGEEE